MERDPSNPIDCRAFLESTPVIPWEMDAATGLMQYVGPQAVEILGHPLAAWLEESFWEDHVLPDDQAAVMAARARLSRSGESHVIEYRLEHGDGHVVWVSETATAVWKGEEVVRLRGLLSDVTERKRLEQSLAESEERQRALLRSAPDALILTDESGTILNMNEQGEYLLGYPLEEVVGSLVDPLVPRRLRRRLEEHRDAFQRDPNRRSLVDGHSFCLMHKDGEELPVELSLSSVSTLRGRQFLLAFRDLTARRRVEAQLRASERRIRSMAQALPAAVCFVDQTQRYRFVNDAYATWVGSSPGEIEGRLVRQVLGETLYARLRPLIEEALDGRAVQFRADVFSLSGAEIEVNVSYVPHWEDGHVGGYFIVVTNPGSEVDARYEREGERPPLRYEPTHDGG